jgi:membrane-bound lytic murein transglycosylase B
MPLAMPAFVLSRFNLSPRGHQPATDATMPDAHVSKLLRRDIASRPSHSGALRRRTPVWLMAWALCSGALPLGLQAQPVPGQEALLAEPAKPSAAPRPATAAPAPAGSQATKRPHAPASRKAKASRVDTICRAAPGGEPYATRTAVRDFARDLASQFPDLDAASTLQTLAQACYQPDVAQLIMPPANPQTRNWAAYRARFVEPQHIRAGLAFWAENQRWLTIAEQRYGVPAEVIVGILGVETLYGRHMGNFRVLDALATLAFDFPSGRSDRSAFFREQLGALLRLAQREGVDPASIKGSYAGAIGWGQFMPGSWLAHAVDFNGDSRIDLRTSLPDVIGSVANFLAAHGWQSGMPARFDVEPPEDPDQLAALLEPDIRPVFTRTELEDGGAVLDEFGREHTGLLALVELRNGDASPSYVAGTENFWALTRYNWSAYYAMAVLDLGEAVSRERGHGADRSNLHPTPTTRKTKRRP